MYVRGKKTMQTKNTKATWRKKDIDRIIEDRIIRDVWHFLKQKKKKQRKNLEKKTMID